MKVSWEGVFPAATTQFAPDLSIDLAATQKVQDALVRDGVHGLIIMGTVGENNSLEPDEKRAVLKAAAEAVAGRVPIIAGVSELDTKRAIAFAPHLLEDVTHSSFDLGTCGLSTCEQFLQMALASWLCGFQYRDNADHLAMRFHLFSISCRCCLRQGRGEVRSRLLVQ